MPTLRLRRRDEVHAEGVTPGRLTTLVRTGALLRVRAGVYVDGEAWQRTTDTDRTLARARALAMTSQRAPIFAVHTAAALHGMPLFRPPTSIHVIAPVERPGRARGVVRHRGILNESDVVTISGLSCTSLTRTLADLARIGTFEQSVTVTDAALRRQFLHRQHYDSDGAAAFIEDVLAVVGESARGRAKAHRALGFADGRAELPGESISRIRLHQAGFAPPELQVCVAGPGGQDYFVDFGIDEAEAFGEFDGAVKYVDGRMLDGLSTAEAFQREKRREDWIRGITGRRFVRWGWQDIATPDALASRLAQFGVRPSL
ncbi:hypothetical protein [Microbacterium sp. SLBN-146]|uniref:hypothetical protein n=1 Tax=Microbacterium sp. SLBN-146 TaxID=2768457 RepID=UPI00114DC895|nr:hypothetical protein [Microbacterium sp. SLBN-146]TQJ32758.1 hypothetical protein FBY39_3272 [Microbacterium sp. SLBN-146]